MNILAFLIENKELKYLRLIRRRPEKQGKIEGVFVYYLTIKISTAITALAIEDIKTAAAEISFTLPA